MNIFLCKKPLKQKRKVEQLSTTTKLDTFQKLESRKNKGKLKRITPKNFENNFYA